MYNKKEILDFLKNSVAGKVSVEEQVKFLRAFKPEKVSAEQLKIFADFMLGEMVGKLKMPEAIDVCGTGGSGLARINTSTIGAFILAELGVGVAKHGNKAASGRFGSFDLLEEMGLDIEMEAKELEEKYRNCGLAFIFARNFHPAMKHFVEARKASAGPTIFNLLGPLLNPAGVKKQIIGCSFKGQMRLIAEACRLMGKERVMVVRGRDGLDEVTLSGKTDVVELYDGEISEYCIGPKDFGIEACDFIDIEGGDNEFNLDVASEILNDTCESRHADLVYVNVAMALKLAGVCEDLQQGYEMARSVVGAAKMYQYEGNILGEIGASKVLKRSYRDFKGALMAKGVSLIAEIKKASPSEGVIFKGDFDPGKIAKIYEANGAKAISVLTDYEYFQGSFDYLREASMACSLPILCKDFIIYNYQIFQARASGADAILLIAALLSAEKMKRFLLMAETMGMDCLVEVRNEEELELAQRVGAEIIGINNRDLRTFELDPAVTKRLIKKVKPGKVVVSESGINCKEDVQKLGKRVNAILVGSAIMKSKNMAKKIRELI